MEPQVAWAGGVGLARGGRASAGSSTQLSQVQTWPGGSPVLTGFLHRGGTDLVTNLQELMVKCYFRGL